MYDLEATLTLLATTGLCEATDDILETIGTETSDELEY